MLTLLHSGGGAKGVAGSAEASYAKEQSTASQNVSKTDVQSLMVTYNVRSEL